MENILENILKLEFINRSPLLGEFLKTYVDIHHLHSSHAHLYFLLQ